MNKKRKLTKKIAAWLMCLAMVLTTINLPAFTIEVKAVDTVEIDGIDYVLHDSQKEATVYGKKTENTEINVPENITYDSKTYKVTTIACYAFMGRTELTSITIPSSITRISYGAFENCSNLTSVTIPSSITKIEKETFLDCRSLTNVTIPSSVTVIEQSAFKGCSGLTNVTIPSSVTEIQNQAFGYCSGLTSVTIPSSVTTINEKVFGYCSGLTSVTIPSSVTEIGNYAFGECSGLTSVTIPSSVTTIGKAPFLNCSESNLIISIECSDYLNSITTWGKYKSIEKINHHGGTATCVLKAVCEVCGESYGDFDSNNHDFSEETHLCVCGVEEPFTNGSCGDAASYKFYECGTLVISGTGAIMDYAFLGSGPKAEGFTDTSKIQNVVIENGITDIGRTSFAKCSALKTVKMADSVINMASYPFDTCPALISVDLSKNLKTIGQYAFQQCTSLEKIVLPDSIESIEQMAFYKCTSLSDITIPASLSITDIPRSVFRETPWLEMMRDDNSLVVINNVLYDGTKCSGDCIIPNGVVRVGDTAFVQNADVVSITIPSSVISIGRGAWANCHNLSRIVFEGKVESIDDEAFLEYYGKPTIVVPDEFLNYYKQVSVLSSYTIIPASCDAGEHHYEADEEGHTCSFCGATGKHDFDDDGVCKVCEYECTHKNEGVSTFVEGKCSICDYDCVTKEHVKNTNNWLNKNATEHESTCSVCEIVVTGNHDFSQSEYQTNVAGKHYQICALCQAESEKVDCTAGTPVRENEVAATCTEDGSYDEVTYCTVCKQELSRDKKTITKTGHKFTTYTSNDDATCTENATETAKCDNEGCSETDTRKIADSALGHHYVFTKYDWKTDGSACDVIVTCDRDGCDSVEKHIATITSKVTKDATCKEKGTTTYTAAYETYTDTLDVDDVDINPDNHQGETEIKDKKEATCGETGYTGDTYCRDCGVKLSSGTSIDKKAHVWDEGTITTEPTCTEEGVRTYTCLNDASHTKTEVEPKLGHDFATEYTVDKEPTYTEKGSKSKHCSRCDATTDVTEIPMLVKPSAEPTVKPSEAPSTEPTVKPSEAPSTEPTVKPSDAPDINQKVAFHVNFDIPYVGEEANSLENIQIDESDYVVYAWLMEHTSDSSLDVNLGQSLITKDFLGNVFEFTDKETFEGMVHVKLIDTMTPGATYYTRFYITRKDKQPIYDDFDATEINASINGNVVKGSYCKQGVFEVCDSYTFEVEPIVATIKPAPSASPSVEPSQKPSVSENDVPTATPSPSQKPSVSDNDVPTATPSQNPSVSENDIPTAAPSEVPSETPSEEPSSVPSEEPSAIPSEKPSELPSENPSVIPSEQPSVIPSVVPSTSPSVVPSTEPSKAPEVGDVVPDKNTNGNYTITAKTEKKQEVVYEKPVDKTKTKYVIPATVKVDGITYKITKIEKGAFKKNTKIKEISVGKNVKSIGKDAFSGANKLTKVTLPKNVESIGTNAFKGCTSLKSLTLGTKINAIGANAFNGCKNMKTLIIKSTKLTSKNVAKNAFKGLTKATTIKVPKKKLDAYKKLFKSKGLSSKVKVVAY